MNSKYLTLFSVCIILFIFQYLFQLLPFYSSEAEFEKLFDRDSFETTLALGAKLKFETLTQYELELIPGISSTLAKNILDRRNQILTAAKHTAPDKTYTLLEKAHGVGKGRAEALAKFIELPSATEVKSNPQKKVSPKDNKSKQKRKLPAKKSDY